MSNGNSNLRSVRKHELMENVQKRYGMVPNSLRAMAISPAVLEGYLSLCSALESGFLERKLCKQLSLLVSQCNGSKYCLAAHTLVGKAIGLNDEDVLDSRRGISPDRKVEVALQFARKVVENKGWIMDEDTERLRKAGYRNEEVNEIVANVVLTIFENYLNILTKPEMDFPEVTAVN